MKEFDIVIIGSGPGGYRAAILGALRGQKIAIIEKETWGGCCLNRGCVPKKDWHHSAKMIAHNNIYAERGIVGELKPDLDQAWKHQRKVVETVRNNYLQYLRRLSVQRYEGHGRILDTNTVEISGESPTTTIKAKHIIIATGSHAHVPDELPLHSGKIISTDMLFDDPVPKGRRVAIVGGGVIGTELAFILSMMGKEILWLAGGKPMHNTDFSFQALRCLNTALDKYKIIPDARSFVEQATIKNEQVTLKFSDGSSEVVDWVLLGTGRRPNTDNLGLENTQIECDEKGFVKRNDYLQTSNENIYVIGDCTSPIMTANQALADATIVIENIINGNSQKQDPNWVPQAIYSATELARVGLDEEKAEDAGFEPAIGFASFEYSPRALGQDETEGFVRLISDMDNGKLLGGEVVGGEAAELIHLISFAPNCEQALQWIATGNVNHPSRSEEILNATETMAKKWGLDDFIFGGNHNKSN